MIVLALCLGASLGSKRAQTWAASREEERGLALAMEAQLRRDLPWALPFSSRSYTQGLLVLALSDAPCGVDCERIRSHRLAKMQSFFTPREQESIRKSGCQDERFFLYWTLKEAYGKALGTGLAMTLAEDRYVLESARRESSELTMPVRGRSSRTGLSPAELSEPEQNAIRIQFFAADDLEESKPQGQGLALLATDTDERAEPTGLALRAVGEAEQRRLRADAFVLDQQWLVSLIGLREKPADLAGSYTALRTGSYVKK